MECGGRLTLAVGWILAEGCTYTSPTMVAVLGPSPLASRLGLVRRYWARYSPEHLRAMLHTQAGAGSVPHRDAASRASLTREGEPAYVCISMSKGLKDHSNRRATV